tara:strand:- start:994 stop:1734 length:741 start_codon:yes stop_codon:yes gene_type:complete
MKSRINFLGIPLDNLTMSETIIKINNAIVSKKQIHHCVINAGKIVKIQSDEVLKDSVISSDIINADGMGVVWGAKFLGHEIRDRVTGIDLMENLVKLAYEQNYSCFFLGAKQEVVEKLVVDYSKKYSKNLIAGYRNGYFDHKEEKKIVKTINESNANFLFVAITSPKKEIFLNKYKNELSSINFIMGVGGSFDVITGKIKRAPSFIQSIGLEWLYRLIQEPKRMWRRYLIGNLKFLILILKAKFKK